MGNINQQTRLGAFAHQSAAISLQLFIRFLHRTIFLLLSLVSVNSCFALDTDDWRVNSWGSAAPTIAFQKFDAKCPREGIASTSFKVVSRGNGDAELTLPGLLEPNKAYKFAVWLRSEKPAVVEVFFRRDGFPYETTAIRSTSVSGWTLLSVTGVHASSGRGSVRIAIRSDNVTLCVNSAVLLPADVGTIGAQDTNVYIEPKFFGVHLNRLGLHNGWPTFDPGTLRLWDTGTTWAQLQPTNAPIDWQKNVYAQRLDYYIKHGLAKHPDLQFIYTLGMTPAWAGSKHPKDCNNSSYGPSICTKPLSTETWRQYVRALGLRYKGVIQVWEIWNEADVWVHWDQTPEELIALVKIAAQELKSIDPANQIIGPNITGAGLRFLSQFLAAGGGAYLDGISIHAYLGRVPELSFGQIRNVRQMLNDSGYGNLPIWNTETAVSCNTLLEDCNEIKTATRRGLSGEDALAQGVIGNAALGIKSFVYYTWEGAAIDYGNLPLVDVNYQVPTKAGRVLSTLKQWLWGSKVKYRVANSAGLNVVEVSRGDALSLVIWSSSSPTSFDLTTFASGSRYERASGGGSHPLIGSHLDVGSEPILISSTHSLTTE